MFWQTEMAGKNQELKHLGFVRIAAIHVLVCLSKLYEYAKLNSGPLRFTVGTIEDAVTKAVGPVYEKYKGVPDHLLVFLDKKVISRNFLTRIFEILGRFSFCGFSYLFPYGFVFWIIVLCQFDLLL